MRKVRARELERQTLVACRLRAELVEVASAASHELLAPLRRIVNLAELLAERGRWDAEAAAVTRRIRESASGLQALVEQLARYAASAIDEPALGDVDVEEAARAAAASLAEEAAACGALVSIAPLPRARADRRLLEAVLRELMRNALKFRGSKPPRVSVTAELHGGELLLTVRDDGPGVPPSCLERIFRVFERVEPRGCVPGAGLGLPLCKRIAESLGGRIWAEAPADGGLALRLALPAADEGAP